MMKPLQRRSIPLNALPAKRRCSRSISKPLTLVVRLHRRCSTSSRTNSTAAADRRHQFGAGASAHNIGDKNDRGRTAARRHYSAPTSL